MNAFLLSLTCYVIGSLAAFLSRSSWKGIVFSLFAGLSLLVQLPLVHQILSSVITAELTFSLSYPIGIVNLRMDPLSAFFVLIISIGGLGASLYSINYMRHYKNSYPLGSYYLFLGLLVISMLLVVTVQNALLFLLVWEMMSLFSFFLVSFEHRDEQVRRAGLYYLIAMQTGAAFLIVAFAGSWVIADSMDFQALQGILSRQSTVSILLIILFLLGFGVKAGFIPFHSWLPLAHPAAPTGVSALMSGVMIKTGIYGILRILLLAGIPLRPIAYAVFILSLLTGLFGIINAIVQHDIKKFLAYSSIENIGIIGVAIGLGMLGLSYGEVTLALIGFTACLLHILNHFLFKSLLFYTAGIVYANTHTRDIGKLGGLAHQMPVSALLFLIGSLAICGLPPLNGFISEFLIYIGLFRGLTFDNVSLNVMLMVGVISLALIGIMALLAFTRVFGFCFLGKPRKTLQPLPHEGSALFHLPSLVFSLAMLFIGMGASFILPMTRSIVHQFLPNADLQAINAVSANLISVNRAVIIFTAFLLGFYALRLLLLRRKSVTKFKTWDCGYQEDSGRLQYSPDSYSAPFIKLAAFLVAQKHDFNGTDELFPQSSSHKSRSRDLIEKAGIQPLLRVIRQLFSLFNWIQSGRTQQYILYGLIFLIILVIWIIGVR